MESNNNTMDWLMPEQPKNWKTNDDKDLFSSKIALVLNGS
jgi:hypothetical protein